MALKEEVIKGVTFNFRDEVINTGSKIYPKEEFERFKLCLQCGKCTGGCPAGRRTAWRIRKIFEETSTGQKEKVFSDDSLWNCTTCYTCQERCPRGIPTTDVIRVIRNLAAKSGNMKPAHRKTSQNLLTYGHAVPINDETKEARKKLGLTEMPPTVQGVPECLQEIVVILDKTGFKKLIEGEKK